jgi:membrane protein DedA with SNARE-associated domain
MNWPAVFLGSIIKIGKTKVQTFLETILIIILVFGVSVGVAAWPASRNTLK